jgi:hypothetical protein
MIRQFWRLTEGGEDNLGPAITGDGLVLGRTPLIERRDGHFVVREKAEIERLLSRAYQTDLAADRLMPGLATVASALNANDPCLAHIAAVHLRIPDLPNQAARDEMEAAEILIKSTDWNPALHPRAGVPPNPGWFAPTAGSDGDSSPAGTAQNDAPTQRSDIAPNINDNWVRLPPGQYIDELHDFLEWLANAKPQDEAAIRAEIKRYYYDVGDAFGGDTLNHVFSDVLEAGNNAEWRQQLLDSIEAYAKTDPAEMGLMHGLLPATILAIPSIAAENLEVQGELLETPTAASTLSVDPWTLGWAKRGQYFDELFRDGSLPPLFRTIDNFTDGIATSIKSIDLNAATYQDAARLTYRLNKYIGDLGEYEGGILSNMEVSLPKISARTLKLIMPKGVMTDIQRAQSRQHARGHG